MEDTEKLNFEKANKVVHKVEDQWHYPIMTKAGYEAIDKTGIGFSRTYKYVHPVTKHRMAVTTGINADYWTDLGSSEGGYWSALEKHLESIKK